MIFCIQAVWNSKAELCPGKTSTWAHVPVCHSGIGTVTLAAGHSSHAGWKMLLGCHSMESHQSCPAKALCLDMIQKLPSAALSDTTLAAGKSRKQPPPISRNLCCLVCILCNPGWFFFCYFSFLSSSFAGLSRPGDVQSETASVFALCLTQWATALA